VVLIRILLLPAFAFLHPLIGYCFQSLCVCHSFWFYRLSHHIFRLFRLTNYRFYLNIGQICRDLRQMMLSVTCGSTVCPLSMPLDWHSVDMISRQIRQSVTVS
jgi:hypothetical protein